jgi:hypothetical protein
MGKRGSLVEINAAERWPCVSKSGEGAAGLELGFGDIKVSGSIKLPTHFCAEIEFATSMISPV